MARLKNGLLGGLSGSIGPVTGYILNGQLVIRSRRSSSKEPPTEKQLATRQAMTVVNQFLKVCSPFVQIGFAGAGNDRLPAYSRAVSYLMRQAIVGVYPDLA